MITSTVYGMISHLIIFLFDNYKFIGNNRSLKSLSVKKKKFILNLDIYIYEGRFKICLFKILQNSLGFNTYIHT